MPRITTRLLMFWVLLVAVVVAGTASVAEVAARLAVGRPIMGLAPYGRLQAANEFQLAGISAAFTYG